VHGEVGRAHAVVEQNQSRGAPAPQQVNAVVRQQDQRVEDQHPDKVPLPALPVSEILSRGVKKYGQQEDDPDEVDLNVFVHDERHGGDAPPDFSWPAQAAAACAVLFLLYHRISPRARAQRMAPGPHSAREAGGSRGKAGDFVEFEENCGMINKSILFGAGGAGAHMRETGGAF
jgi:hypothetical protein